VRSRLVPAALLSSALLLSGCGTGLHATTYTKERAPRDFANASLADLEVRNLGIAAPSEGDTLTAGQTAVLTGSVVNRGDKDDTLVGIESTAAGASSLYLDGKAVSEVTVPAGGDASTWSALLTGLRNDVRVGSYVEVTLVFRSAGRLEGVKVPVRNQPEQDPYKSAE